MSASSSAVPDHIFLSSVTRAGHSKAEKCAGELQCALMRVHKHGAEHGSMHPAITVMYDGHFLRKNSEATHSTVADKTTLHNKLAM